MDYLFSTADNVFQLNNDGDRNMVIVQGPVQTRVSFRCLWRTKGFWPVEPDLLTHEEWILDGRSRSSRLWLNFPSLGELVGVPVEDFLGNLARIRTDVCSLQEAPQWVIQEATLHFRAWLGLALLLWLSGLSSGRRLRLMEASTATSLCPCMWQLVASPEWSGLLFQWVHQSVGGTL